MDTLHTTLKRQLDESHPTSLPREGQFIRFTTPPCGSYASTGDIYLVEDYGDSLYFRNQKTGGGTFDKKWAVARAKWEEVPTEQLVAKQNALAARSTLTTGELYLDALNKSTRVAFSSGSGACQVREF